MTIQEKEKFILRAAIVAWLIAMLGAGLLIHSAGKNVSLTKDDISVLNDTLHTSRDKDGTYKAGIAVITNEQVLALASKDSTIKRLSTLLEVYKTRLGSKGSVTVITLEGKGTGVGKTTIIRDTCFVDPVYKSQVKLGDWAKADITATKDTTTMHLETKEELGFAILGEEKRGFLGLGKSKPYCEVTLKNPYNTVKTLRTYQVKVPEKKWGVGPQLGAGLSSGRFNLYIGLGVQYNLIQF